MKIHSTLLTTALCLLLSACSAHTPSTGGEFSAPGLEQGEGIAVESDENSSIFALDEHKLDDAARVWVTPGRHALGVRYVFPRFREPPLEKESTFNFNAAPGRTYRIAGKLAGNGRTYIWLVDQASGRRVAGMEPPPVGGAAPRSGSRSTNEVLDIEIVEQEGASDAKSPGAAERRSPGAAVKRRVR